MAIDVSPAQMTRVYCSTDYTARRAQQYRAARTFPSLLGMSRAALGSDS